ncbi:tetratricopeptide repeat protein [Paenibacillus sp. S-38]|uniref:tetratricopeptide repeat protein n=1 Tax=Paenibacillus sp. S-38 TaxID=3416710 RepID=UPI003CEAC384
MALLQQAVEEHPEDPYFKFQLAKEYRLIGEYDKADEIFTQCYNLLQGDEAFYPLAIVDFLYNTLASKNFEAGLKIIEQEERYLYEYPDFYLACGHFYRELVYSDIEKNMNYYPLIERCFQACLEIGETDRYDGVRGAGSTLPAYELGVIYETTGDMVKAKEHTSLPQTVVINWLRIGLQS